MPGGKAPDRTRGTSANEANGCGPADTRDMRTATACPPAGRTQNDSAGGSGPDYFLCGKTPVRLCYNRAMPAGEEGQRGPMKQWNAFGLAMQLSWTLVFSLLLPLGAGILLYKYTSVGLWGILLGAALGVLASTVGVARMAIRVFGASAGSQSQTETAVEGEEESHE